MFKFGVFAVIKHPNSQNLLTILSFTLSTPRYDHSGENCLGLLFAGKVGENSTKQVSLEYSYLRLENSQQSKDNENLVF